MREPEVVTGQYATFLHLPLPRLHVRLDAPHEEVLLVGEERAVVNQQVRKMAPAEKLEKLK